MSTHDPTKRVPKSLGTETKLFGSYTLTDVGVALFPGVVVVLLTQVVLPPGLTIAGYAVQSLLLPLAGVAIAVGALFVFLTPTYTTSLDWILAFASFQGSERELDHDAAKERTRVERIHPDHDAIERTDGALVGFVRVEPPMMALATDAEWRAKATAFQDFLNTSVEFPIQFYSTTRAFPVEKYLKRYEQRLSDADVRANPRLSALIREYVEWYRRDLDERRMTIRDHYVVVPVTPQEVQFQRESLRQRATAVPVLGRLLQAVFAPPVAEERAAMLDALDERLRRVETGLREIDGCQTERVDVADGVNLLSEYWAGQSRTYGDLRQALRTRPLVASGGSP